MKCHFTPVRMAIISESTNRYCKDVEKREYLLHWGIQTGATNVESSMEISQKIKNGSALWPSNPISGNVSKETQNTNLKEHKHPYVHCSIICNLQDMEAAQVFISKWVDKTTMGHLHNGILLGYKKKEENFTLCNSIDWPGEHYAKWNKLVRKREIPYDFTCSGI